MNQAKIQKAAAVASFACAIHCAALPILLAAGAAGAVSWLAHEPVEWGLVLLAAVVGSVSAWKGFRKHGNRSVAVVMVVAAVSLVLLTLGHSGEHAEEHNHAVQWLAPVAGIALGVSLLVNRRMCATCHDCHDCADHAEPAA